MPVVVMPMMMSPVVRQCVLLFLVVVSVLLLMISVVAMLSPQVSLSLLTSLCQMVQAPLLHVINMYGHLPQDFPPHVEVLMHQEGPAGTEMAEDEEQSSKDRIWWYRQLLFVFTLVVCQPYPGLLILLTRFIVWWVGVRIWVYLLIGCLAWLLEFELDSQLPLHRILPFCGPGQNVWSRQCVIVYLAHVLITALALSHCAMVVSAWELLGLLLLSICSDPCVQTTLKFQAQRFQIDLMEGFEGEVMHGLLLLLDLTVCVAFFTRACYQGHPFVMMMTYVNGPLILLELWTKVVQKVREGLRQVSEVPYATWRQLRNYNDVCAVCLCAMSAARITRCGHLFHSKCLRQALCINHQCPLCNEKLVSQYANVEVPEAEMER